MKKKILLTIFCIILLFIISACGQKGNDGDILLKIKLYYSTAGYWDNNSSIPYGFSQSTFYDSNSGSYNFEYWWIDDIGNEVDWTGTYTLTADEGEEGGLFADGEDGVDKYYTLNCYAAGPSLDVEYGGPMNWGRTESQKNEKFNCNEDQIIVEKHKTTKEVRDLIRINKYIE